MRKLEDGPNLGMQLTSNRVRAFRHVQADRLLSLR